MRYKFEIWIGWYDPGQGSDPPISPELVGAEWARSFEEACYIFKWFYDPKKKNRNSSTGKYYETEEEAWKSFPKYSQNHDNT